MMKKTVALWILCGMVSFLGGCASDPAKLTTAPAPAKVQKPASEQRDAAPFNPTSE